jgi:hypothetical protein
MAVQVVTVRRQRPERLRLRGLRRPRLRLTKRLPERRLHWH